MSTRHWNHNTHYHRLALELVASTGAGTALDVGCGEGLLTRELRAAGVAAVTGLDLDPAQVDRARVQSSDGVRYLVGDVLEVPRAERFDLVTCFATLHHLDLEEGLRRLRELVAPGGHLLVVGLAQVRSPTDAVLGLAAVPVALVVDHVRGTWEHGAPVRDPEHSYGEVRDAARRILPGARWRRRLYWRYSLVWQAPA